jgi:hypothetical protein
MRLLLMIDDGVLKISPIIVYQECETNVGRDVCYLVPNPGNNRASNTIVQLVTARSSSSSITISAIGSSFRKPFGTIDEGDAEEGPGLQIGEGARPSHAAQAAGTRARAFVLAVEGGPVGDMTAREG